jgi:hypothetical protein
MIMGENALPHMMQFEIILPPLLGMLGSMFCMSKRVFSQHHLSNHHNDEWILCLQHIVFSFWQM